jgi:hypothetical protein
LACECEAAFYTEWQLLITLDTSAGQKPADPTRQQKGVVDILTIRSVSYCITIPARIGASNSYFC